MKVAGAMREAAISVVDSLDAVQRARAMLPFELEGERTT